MNLQARIKIVEVLSSHLKKMSEDDDGVIRLARVKNPWFVPEFTKRALLSLVAMTSKENIEEVVGAYSVPDTSEKVIGVIMAGNIPAVGFHDFLMV